MMCDRWSSRTNKALEALNLLMEKRYEVCEVCHSKTNYLCINERWMYLKHM